MGLTVHSLTEFPIQAERDYYVYLLRGSWDDEIAQALTHHFPTMADKASRTGAAVIAGTEGKHFNNEVFSWHHLNGVEMEDHLPCLLITTLHPSRFRSEYPENWKDLREEYLLVAPLRAYSREPGKISDVLDGIFRDIRDRKELKNFEVARQMRPGKAGALMNALILRPSFAGIGIDLKEAGKTFFKAKQ